MIIFIGGCVRSVACPGFGIGMLATNEELRFYCILQSRSPACRHNDISCRYPIFVVITVTGFGKEGQNKYSEIFVISLKQTIVKRGTI
jgi:hypothetical protein